MALLYFSLEGPRSFAVLYKYKNSSSVSEPIVNLTGIASNQMSSLRNLYLYNIGYFVQEHIHLGLNLTYFNKTIIFSIKKLS